MVRPDSVEETDEVLKSAKAAGLEIPESDEKERREQAQIEGVLVDFGGNAFEDWGNPIPERGQKVVYDKYAGFVKQIDGVNHRIIRDTDLFMVEGD